MLAPVRHAVALFTALVVAILGSAAVPLAAAHADKGGNSETHAAQGQPDKAQGDDNKAAQAEKSKPAKSAPAESAPAKEPKAEKPAEQGSGSSDSSAQGKPAKAAQSGGGDEKVTENGSESDPAGNNGTIKLAGFVDGNGPGHSSGSGSEAQHPSNDPHLPCEFSVEGYGFDTVADSSTNTFVPHAPTRGGDGHVGAMNLDDDSHAGGGSTAGYDGVADYGIDDLDFDSEAHPKHGYHVKLTTTTDYSQGSDRKHKVFWVEECDTTTEVDDDTEVDDEEESDEDETDEGDEDDTEVEGDEETVDNDSDDSSTEDDNNVVEVAGVQTQAPNSAQAAPLANVPTAVAAGVGEEIAELTRSPLPLGLVLLGMGLIGAALYRRVRA